MTYTITSNNSSVFGYVDREKISMATGVIPIPGIGSGADGNEGITRTNPNLLITVKGTWVGNNISDIRNNFIVPWINLSNTAASIANKLQSTSVPYNSDLLGYQIYVRVVNVAFEAAGGEVTSVPYTIELQQNNSNS